MINLVNDDQDRFFVRRPKSDFPEFVRIFRNGGAVLAKFERRVGVDQNNFIGFAAAVRRHIQTFDVFYHRTAAESFQKLALEGSARSLVNLLRHVRQINLNSRS